MFAKLKIGTRLFLLVAFLLLATLAIGGYGLVALQQAQAANAAGLQMSSELITAVEGARAADATFKLQIQEFKNLLLRGHEQKDHDQYLAAFQKNAEQVRAELGAVQEALHRLGIRANEVDEAVRMHQDITGRYLEALGAFVVGQQDTAQLVDRKVRGQDRPLDLKIGQVVRVVEEFARQESARMAETGSARSRTAIAVFGSLVVLVASLAVSAGAIVIRGLLRELGGEPAYAREVAERIADGDLSIDVQVAAGDRRSLVLAMQKMAIGLRSLVGEVASGAHTVADTSAQIAQGNTDLSQRTEEQASTLEETASQMEELTTTVTQNADNARQANELAAGASAVARKGGAVVEEVVRTMGGISDASRKIADIIGVIDGIAFQTNILALNAAVEAARAGEQGRGFAVVAAEVRNLAQRSASAAKEIKSLIGDSVDKVDAGTRLVDDAGRTMEEIVESVDRVSALVAEIAAASQEQSAGIEQVNTAVTQMDHVVQQNATLVEEANAATESMKQQSRTLLASIARFRLGAESAPVASPPAAVRSIAQASVVAPIAFRAATAQAPSSRPAPAPRAVTPPAPATEEWRAF